MTFTLGVRRLVESSEDSHGNVTSTFAAPVPWVVRGCAPGANADGQEPHRDASIVLWTVYADSSDDIPTEYDLVVLDAVEYAVEGRPADWTKGPWANPVAGVVVELKRVGG